MNVDLKQMNYDEFKRFMQDLAALYSGVSDDGWMALHDTLKSLAVIVRSPISKIMKNGNEVLQYNPFGFYGAYEIADNQVVMALFYAEFSEDKVDNRGFMYCELATKVCFAEDDRLLRCPHNVRERLTQIDYVNAVEMVYPVEQSKSDIQQLRNELNNRLKPTIKH
ncbi:hypothetical protein A6B43_06375 [Vespertiliibacter pulmonis]|uniref:Uncharacterized protein n=1 Tax=Vespertiliibacter pulmonis TaxID=1443036 RepID=A0A3N4VKV8_9PAST|nr:hypothetical protein [Vespertiliibacter pulmonis]QLB21170.1 hypothetical protein A6B43_06375 [Vespertiliibacter pulmonis]RPE83722.1 hypothetical protein EDC46_0923 [Vespertiliibacter pulmonis]